MRIIYQASISVDTAFHFDRHFLSVLDPISWPDFAGHTQLFFSSTSTIDWAKLFTRVPALQGPRPADLG